MFNYPVVFMDWLMHNLYYSPNPTGLLKLQPISDACISLESDAMEWVENKN